MSNVLFDINFGTDLYSYLGVSLALLIEELLASLKDQVVVEFLETPTLRRSYALVPATMLLGLVKEECSLLKLVQGVAPSVYLKSIPELDMHLDSIFWPII
jgi:hypothetical protein